ncbi:hypothetical protein F4779DRAFT_182966 [Xylariaceae sp. FL0662B]|nr:hypothetical protein F4779DRAFT_182966 [Xylariaceae sp. FL0662B]
MAFADVPRGIKRGRLGSVVTVAGSQVTSSSSADIPGIKRHRTDSVVAVAGSYESSSSPSTTDSRAELSAASSITWSLVHYPPFDYVAAAAPGQEVVGLDWSLTIPAFVNGSAGLSETGQATITSGQPGREKLGADTPLRPLSRDEWGSPTADTLAFEAGGYPHWDSQSVNNDEDYKWTDTYAKDWSSPTPADRLRDGDPKLPLVWDDLEIEHELVPERNGGNIWVAKINTGAVAWREVNWGERPHQSVPKHDPEENPEREVRPEGKSCMTTSPSWREVVGLTNCNRCASREDGSGDGQQDFAAEAPAEARTSAADSPVTASRAEPEMVDDGNDIGPRNESKHEPRETDAIIALCSLSRGQ